VALGNQRLLIELGVDSGPLGARAETLGVDGQTVVFLVADGRVAGLLGVADAIKASTPEAVRALQTEGLKVVMLTGDNRITAQAVPGPSGSTR
jgi:Cu+-exporting ATPase